MALDIFDQFATDENLENNGSYFDIGGGARILVARAGNKKYGKALTKLVEQNRQILDQANDVAESKSDEILISVMAETILLNWEGVSFKGADLPYSLENAKMLLGIKDFRKLVGEKSNDITAYKFKLEKDQGKA
jgi:hypothetical protein